MFNNKTGDIQVYEEQIVIVSKKYMKEYYNSLEVSSGTVDPGGMSSLGKVDDIAKILQKSDDVARQIISKRDELLEIVTNKKLSNTIKEMYCKGATIADTIRYEIKTGNLAGGKSHIPKGIERIKNLKNILKKEILNEIDLDTTLELLEDLSKSLDSK